MSEKMEKSESDVGKFVAAPKDAAFELEPQDTADDALFDAIGELDLGVGDVVEVAELIVPPLPEILAENLLNDIQGTLSERLGEETVGEWPFENIDQNALKELQEFVNGGIQGFLEKQGAYPPEFCQIGPKTELVVNEDTLIAQAKWAGVEEGEEEEPEEE
jgi:hypothetical protein